MAEIWVNKKIPEYFVECDYTDANSLKNLPKLYEQENVILLRNKKIDFDVEFFSRVSLPQDREYKKFKAVNFVKTYRTPGDQYPTLAADCFGGDRAKADYFYEQVKSILAQIEDILNAAAPGYRIKQQRFTLRCSLTINENLHLDVYKEDIPTHHFRLFVNLDSAHRIWHTSWRLTDVVKRMDEMSQDDLTTLSPGQLIRKLNFHVFGGLDSRYEDREARHVAFFESGEVWFVDSRRVSHQIFYGRRAISTESVVDAENMDDPSLHYLAIADRRRQDILNARA